MTANATQSGRLVTLACRWVLVSAFALGISLPLLDWRFELDHTPELTENRSAAPAPAWPTHPAEWKALPGLLESYWNDAFGFRRQLIRWHAIAKWALGVSASPNVIIGRHSRLFYAGDQSMDQHRGLRPFTDIELKNWADQLENRRKWLASRGAHYLFVIAPNKQTVYPETVPDRYGPLGRTPVDQLLETLRGHPELAVLDLRGLVRSAKANGNVFHYTDTHWNDYGAFVGYSAIVQKLHDWYPQMTSRPRAAFTIHRTRPWNGDLALMLGGIFDVMTETSEQWEPLEPVRVREVPIAGYRPPQSARYSIYQGANPALPRAVVFHDSYLLAADERVFPGQVFPARAFLPPTPTFRQSALLAEQFARTACTWQYAFDAQLVLSEHPDVVIEEHLERQLIWGPEGAVPSVAH